jgi:hypothetical protein
VGLIFNVAAEKPPGAMHRSRTNRLDMLQADVCQGFGVLVQFAADLDHHFEEAGLRLELGLSAFFLLFLKCLSPFGLFQPYQWVRDSTSSHNFERQFACSLIL